jgi:hypothetical protein
VSAIVSPSIRGVSSPLSAEMLSPLDSRCRTVQFNRAMTDADYRTLADFLLDHPSVCLRAYGSYDGSITDLDFLRFFPSLRRFSADALYHSLANIEGLGYLPADAVMLGVGRTKKRLSLEPIARFSALRRLHLEGQTKDIDAVSELRSLISLTLRSITLPDLSLLRPLTQLRALDLKLGGIRDLALLPQIGRLEYLEVWMVKGLCDLAPIADVASMEFLLLQSLRQVVALPTLAKLDRLTHVWLETMKGLTDLAPLATAPARRQVAIVDMGHLQPEDLSVLATSRSIQNVRAGLGSRRKNDQVARLLPPSAPPDWTRPAALSID